MTARGPRRSNTARRIVTSVVTAFLAIAGAACTAKHVTGRGSISSTASQQQSSAGSPSAGSPSTSDPSTGDPSTGDRYTLPELAEAKQIPGLTYQLEPEHIHVVSPAEYDASPPVGGNHSQIWADCTGTVYPNPIANENAVHMLEHGAVWITYQPGLAADQVATLSRLVDGVDHLALSPYPDLRTKVSLQAWGYQLFVDNASDPRIEQFIKALRSNPQTTPELGGSCADPAFKAHPSTFGHPIFHL